MANPWFRMYAEFVNDPKVQMLSEQDQRRFIMLLCVRCSNEKETLPDEEVTWQLRISNEEWLKTKVNLLDKNLIDDNNFPVAWDKRQYISDTSSDRVKKHREKRRAKGLKGQDHINAQVRRDVLNDGKNPCVYCESSEDLTIDHKTPTQRGGTNKKDNLQVACRGCNADKRNMTHDEYLAWEGRVTFLKRPQTTDTDTEKELDQYEEVSLRMKDKIIKLFPLIESLYAFEFEKWRTYRQGKKPVLDLSLNLMDWMKRAAGKITKPKGLPYI